MNKKKKIKYVYKEKEYLHAKLILGEMTLADVLKVVCHPAYLRACRIQVHNDIGTSEQFFRVVGDELHTFKMMYTPFREYESPTILWFKLDEKVKVRGDIVEIKPLKGVQRKMIHRLQFCGTKKPICIVERTQPENAQQDS